MGNSGFFLAVERVRKGILWLIPLLVLLPYLPLEEIHTSRTNTLEVTSSYVAMPVPYYPFHRSLPSPTYLHYSEYDTQGTAEAMANHQLRKDWIRNKQASFDFSPILYQDFVSTGAKSPSALTPLVQKFGVMSLVKPFPTKDKFLVLLDAGHGGSDPGTIGTHGLLEKDLTLDISDRVRKLLLAHSNISVALSRYEDVGYSRERRVSDAKSSKADLLISLHFNNLPQKNVTLVESFYAASANILESEFGRISTGPVRANKVSRPSNHNFEFTKDSKRIAEILQRNIYNQVKSHNKNAINAGTKSDTLYMLTQSYIPGTLIELTCLSNPREEARLKTDEYRDAIATAIAEGIIEYFSQMSDSSNVVAAI